MCSFSILCLCIHAFVFKTLTIIFICLFITELKGPVGQVLQYERNVLAVEQNKVLVPPNFSRYIAWGFADHTLRLGNYDSDKAVLTCEAVMHTIGEIVACVCPNSKTIITAGTSSVSF